MNERMDERKDENYIPVSINAGGITNKISIIERGKNAENYLVCKKIFMENDNNEGEKFSVHVSGLQ